MLKITTPPAAKPEALDPTAMVGVLEAEASEEPRIQQLIQDATRLAEQLACRRLWYREYEERLEGDDTDRLYLQARPIASVTSVAFGTDDALVEGTEPDEFEVWPEEGFLYRQAGWLAGTPGWRCRYFGGFWLVSMGTAPGGGEVELDVDGGHIRRAIEDIVRLSYQMDGQDHTVKREKIGGAAPIEYEFRDGLWCPKGAVQVLERLAPIAP